MLILNEIFDGYGGVARFHDISVLQLDRSGKRLLLEYLGNGPTTEHAIRLVRINHFGEAEPEIHLEFRGSVWMPYYLRNQTTSTELFLYRFVGAREPLRLDFEAGLRLIEAAGILDFSLLADGFVQAVEESLYHPLFSVKGGAA